MLHDHRPDFPGASTKLQLQFRGPFRVIEKKFDVNRVIQGVDNRKDYRIVHVDRLKPFVERDEDKKTRLEREAAGTDFTMDEILQERKVRGKTYYLIKWRGYTAKHNTWEPEEHLNDPELLQRFKEREAALRSQPVLSKRKKGAPEPEATPTGSTEGKQEKEKKATSAPTEGGAEWAPKVQQTRSGRISRSRRMEEEVYLGAARGRAAG